MSYLSESRSAFMESWSESIRDDNPDELGVISIFDDAIRVFAEYCRAFCVGGFGWYITSLNYSVNKGSDTEDCVGGMSQIPWLCRWSCFYFWVGDKWHYWKWLMKHLTMLISIFLILLFIFAWLVWINRIAILRRRIWILIRYVVCRTVDGSVFLLNDYFEALAPQHCCQCLNNVIIITSHLLLLRNDYS